MLVVESKNPHPDLVEVEGEEPMEIVFTHWSWLACCPLTGTSVFMVVSYVVSLCLVANSVVLACGKLLI